jgi:hypothetical protein
VTGHWELISPLFEQAAALAYISAQIGKQPVLRIRGAQTKEDPPSIIEKGPISARKEASPAV